MYLATGSRRGSQFSLWDVSGSPTCVMTRCMRGAATEDPEVIEFLTFSRDGGYLAVATGTNIEIWSLPNLNFVSSIRFDEESVSVVEVEFGCLGDKYLTVTHGDENKIQVWATYSGVCELTVDVPEDTLAHFLTTDEILYMVGKFDEDMIEALTINIRTGECATSIIEARGAQYGVVWDYIEREHAVIVAHGAVDGTGCVGRWNLNEDAFMWRREGFDYVQGTSQAYAPLICSEGRRIVVYRCRDEFTVDVLCTESGNSLGSFLLAGCRTIPQLRFLSGDYNAVIISWEKHARPDGTATSMMSIHNFLTNECTWEVEVDCGTIAIQPSVDTVLM
jgi:WD40 repeat protein